MGEQPAALASQHVQQQQLGFVALQPGGGFVGDQRADGGSGNGCCGHARGFRTADGNMAVTVEYGGGRHYPRSRQSVSAKTQN